MTYKYEISAERLALAEEMYEFNLKTKAVCGWKKGAKESAERRQRELAGDKVGVKVESFKEKMREAREQAAAAQYKLEKLQREKERKDKQKEDLKKIREMRIQEAQRLEVGFEDDFVPEKVEILDDEERSKGDPFKKGEGDEMKESALSDFIHNERIAFEDIDDETPHENDENRSESNVIQQSTEEIRQTLTLRNPF